MTHSLMIKLALVLAIILLPILLLFYLITVMPGESLEGELPQLDAELEGLSRRLQTHIQVLSEQIGPRNEDNADSLNQAADYILSEFQSYGYSPLESRFGDGRFRIFNVNHYGTERADEIIVIGAHYDTATSGTPGADDNASGIAGMLEIARALSGQSFERTVRFVAFPNEERPYYNTDLMGSRVTASRSAEIGENIIGMFSLEMLGYYTSESNSQNYPPVIGNFYPDRGNFIALISNMSSRPLLHQSVRAFRKQMTFPSEGMAAPAAIVPAIRRSDNASYWDYGFPAILVTDTSFLRNPNYHRLNDTVDTLDFDSMTRVVQGLIGMFRELADNVE